MGNYRDRLQIVVDILSIASKQAKKTQIMYQANLSYTLLCRYLNDVLNAGLVNLENGDSYVLTAKGKEFLNRHKEYSKRYKSFEKHLSYLNNERAVLEKMCLNVNKVNQNLKVQIKNRKIRR